MKSATTALPVVSVDGSMVGRSAYELDRNNGATRHLTHKRSSRREDDTMASESKVQKVARQVAMRQSIGTCKCGGELIWARVILNRPRMMKVCEKCGAISLNGQAGLC
jgi:hypothetical protein